MQQWILLLLLGLSVGCQPSPQPPALESSFVLVHAGELLAADVESFDDLDLGPISVHAETYENLDHSIVEIRVEQAGVLTSDDALRLSALAADLLRDYPTDEMYVVRAGCDPEKVSWECSCTLNRSDAAAAWRVTWCSD